MKSANVWMVFYTGWLDGIVETKCPVSFHLIFGYIWYQHSRIWRSKYCIGTEHWSDAKKKCGEAAQKNCCYPWGAQHFVLPPSCPKSDIFSAGIVLVELLMAGVAGDGPIWKLGRAWQSFIQRDIILCDKWWVKDVKDKQCKTVRGCSFDSFSSFFFYPCFQGKPRWSVSQSWHLCVMVKMEPCLWTCALWAHGWDSWSFEWLPGMLMRGVPFWPCHPLEMF